MGLLLVAAFALFVQMYLLPHTAFETARLFPEVEHLASPYLIGLELAVVGLEVALVAGWFLADTERGSAARRLWANLASTGLAIMLVLVAAVCGHASVILRIGGPLVGLAFLVATFGILGLVVWRTAITGPAESTV